MAERSPATEPRGLENLWHEEALRLRPKLTSVARRVVRNRAEAEEIADEAIARLVRKARGEGLPDEIAGWLHRTALRLAIDQARHWVRRQRPGWLHTVGRRTGVLSAEEELERRETGDRVWRTILELPRRQQGMKTRTFLSRISPILVIALVLLVLIVLGTEIGGMVRQHVAEFLTVRLG